MDSSTRQLDAIKKLLDLLVLWFSRFIWSNIAKQFNQFVVVRGTQLEQKIRNGFQPGTRKVWPPEHKSEAGWRAGQRWRRLTRLAMRWMASDSLCVSQTFANGSNTVELCNYVELYWAMFNFLELYTSLLLYWFLNHVEPVELSRFGLPWLWTMCQASNASTDGCKPPSSKWFHLPNLNQLHQVLESKESGFEMIWLVHVARGFISLSNIV